MKNIEKILKYIETQDLSVSEFERSYGFSNGYLSNTKSRGMDISSKILDKFQTKHPDVYKEVLGVTDVIVAPHHGSPKTADKVIEDLAASSRIHAEASLLREQNYEKMLSHITGNVSAEIPVKREDILKGFHGLIVELGIGKLWDDEEQGERIVNKRVFGSVQKKKVVGSRDGSGK